MCQPAQRSVRVTGARGAVDGGPFFAAWRLRWCRPPTSVAHVPEGAPTPTVLPRRRAVASTFGTLIVSTS
jgi:hypothetical protein